MNKQFGRLTVINERFEKNKWLCQCDCGVVKSYYKYNIKSGHTSSCGCLGNIGQRSLKHGKSNTSEYKTWEKMRERCYDVNNNRYRFYGGKGIIVEWKTFEEFFSDMGSKPSPKHSIDRINNTGNYSKENCRWATVSEQANNTSRNRKIFYRGNEYTMSQAANLIGLNYAAFKARLYNGWSVERIMNTPIREKQRPIDLPKQT